MKGMWRERASSCGFLRSNCEHSSGTRNWLRDIHMSFRYAGVGQLFIIIYVTSQFNFYFPLMMLFAPTLMNVDNLLVLRMKIKIFWPYSSLNEFIKKLLIFPRYSCWGQLILICLFQVFSEHSLRKARLQEFVHQGFYAWQVSWKTLKDCMILDNIYHQMIAICLL